MAHTLVFDTSKLRERAEEVNPIDANETVGYLIAKLKKYKELYALCAPQIGINERVIVFKYNNGVFKEYINPRVFRSEKYHLVREKDISVPEREFISPRPGKIWVEYQTKEARPESNVLKGNSAEIFDRMMNYLDGIPLDDYGLEIMEGFDEAEEDEKEAIIDLYLKSLKTRAEVLNDNIEHDKEAKNVEKAIEFMSAVDEGKVKLEPIDEKELPKKEEPKKKKTRRKKAKDADN